MLGLIVRRLLALIPLLLVVSFAVFSLTYLLPGDPATTIAGGVNASPQDIERVRQEFGFDDPLVTQYGRWLKNAVQLDFGSSQIDGKSVSSQIAEKFPITLSLALSAIVIGILLGVPLGILAATKPGSVRDKFGVGAASVGIAIPNFWLAMVLIAIFAINLGWFPAHRLDQVPGRSRGTGSSTSCSPRSRWECGPPRRSRDSCGRASSTPSTRTTCARRGRRAAAPDALSGSTR